MIAARPYKIILCLLIVALIAVGSLSQRSLNQDRISLGVNRGEALGQSAPPALVFTTVALGGFRGLIANALWIRAMELQEQDKYFEKVQLADWITKLQPRFVTVWIVQAWDMAYNISVKFSSPVDRWMWVQRGLELLRDEAIPINPDEALLYRELAWFFQHKMGADLDDAHFYYKSEWIREMETVLGGTNYVALINPQTDDEIQRARTLRDRYKMDPEIMLEVDQEHGPLEWRLPESHAIYWASVGFKRSRLKDLANLRRVVFQSLQLAFRRGRIMKVWTAEGERFQLLRDLDIIPRANQAYLDLAAESTEAADKISFYRAHRNFLKDAVYFLYAANRKSEAQKWWDYLRGEYPDATFSDARKSSLDTTRLADITLEDYAAAKVTEDIGETSRDRVTNNLIGLLIQSFYFLANDEDDLATGNERLAQVAHARYMREINRVKQQDRIGLDTFPEMKRQALDIFRQNYHPGLVARLYTRLGLPVPQDTPAPAATPEANQAQPQPAPNP
ncbi:MAG: hypothetical protein RI897_2567 [Verrucomicrobiota bacterium]|jgi:hypothetical protein